MRGYREFVAAKLTRQPPTGIDDVPRLDRGLFHFQRDLVGWALRRGRAAIFASTGLGKTRMQLEWAKHVAAHTDRPVIILAPLAVAQQTAAEGARVGMEVALVRESSDVGPGVSVVNYDRVHKIDCSRFGGVVLDESSIIKHQDAATFAQLSGLFAQTPFKLCATATPAPNDYTELGTHAEFLGVCSRAEMLSEFFCHDGGETQTWRLKGHARGAFWKFIASWGALVRAPSDLGYSSAEFELPPLTVEQTIIKADRDSVRMAGLLFAEEASTLSERRDARRATIAARTSACVDAIRADWAASGSHHPVLVWCDLNAEQDALRLALGDEAFSVQGSDDVDDKESRIIAWCAGERPVMISKPSIMGWGLNFQHCSNMSFVGVTDSWEQYYQAVRRCWRFGQKRQVRVRVFASELEGEVVRNLERKERDATRMAAELSRETCAAMSDEVRGTHRQTREYEPQQDMQIPTWLSTES
jgi:hypothetical protein